MPRPGLDPNDPAAWADAYSGGYTYETQARIYGADPVRWAETLASLPTPLQTGQPIAMLGAGIGYSVPVWQALGLGPIVATDTSTYIRTLVDGGLSYAPILNENGLSNGSRNRIKAALGVPNNQPIPWVITEDALPWLTDGECTALNDACFQAGTNIVHIVTTLGQGTEQDPRYNWRTLVAWKAFFSTPGKTPVMMRRDGAEVI